MRGLFAAYLATGDVKLPRPCDRGLRSACEATFYQPDARIYTETPNASTRRSTHRCASRCCKATLRDIYELVAALPGGESREPVLEDRLARLNKLVLDGWDDRDETSGVSARMRQYDAMHIPRGGLQMAERALTGETGRATDEGAIGPPSIDRDSDCVPEVDDAHLPAALADAITFTIMR